MKWVPNNRPQLLHVILFAIIAAGVASTNNCAFHVSYAESVTDLTEDPESNSGVPFLDKLSSFLPWVVVVPVAGVLALVIYRQRKHRERTNGNRVELTGCLKEFQYRNTTSKSTSRVNKGGKKKARKNWRWIALYMFVVLLWGIVFTTTIRSWIVGTEAVVDTLDISYFTLPMLAFNLIFVGTTFVIFGAYVRFYHRAVMEQLNARKMLHDKQTIVDSPVDGKSATTVDLMNPDKQDNNSERPDEFANALSTWLVIGESCTNTQLNEKEHPISQDRPYEIEKGELVSIVIPARDEEAVIGKTILNCLKQSYTNIEVVVVCHNCSDGTYRQAKAIRDNRVRPFELNTKEAGKGIALNYGVEVSKGKYLAILDGDGKLTESFIEDALPLFAAGDYAAVQGRYIPSNRNYNFITRMLSLEGDLWSTPFMTFRSIGTKRTPLGGTGYIIRRDALLDVGGFVNHLVDDYELTFRLLRRDYRIAYAPLCINYDEKPPNLDIMLKQRARWLKGFLNLTKSRVAEPRDWVGHLYWVNPLSAFTGLALLIIAAYSTIHYLLFLYYPFHYSYIPITIWFALTLATFGIYTAALVMQYGRSGFKHAAWLPIYLPFSNYYMIVALKAFFVKSWAETKTVHGFVAENVQGSQSTLLEKKGDAYG